MPLLSADRRAHKRYVRLNVSWVDVKLSVRMVAKYPGLSLVSVLGMALAIAIGAGVFGWVAAVLDPTLPLEGGDRVVRGAIVLMPIVAAIVMAVGLLAALGSARRELDATWLTS
jgi:hypothetical protein